MAITDQGAILRITLPNLEWETLSSTLDVGCEGVAGTAGENNQIFLVGGVTSVGTKLDTCYKVDIANDSITKLGSLSEGRTNHSVVYMNPHLYTYGAD